MNQNAYHAVANSVKEILEYFNDHADIKSISYSGKSQAMIRGGRIVTNLQLGKDYWGFIKGQQLDLLIGTKLPKTKKCLYVLVKEKFLIKPSLTDTNGNKIRNSTVAQLAHVLFGTSIFYFLVEYLKQVDSFKFTRGKFNRVYKAFEKSKTKTLIQSLMFIPLQGLVSEVQCVMLDHEVFIEPLSNDEKLFLLNNTIHPPTFDRKFIENSHFKVFSIMSYRIGDTLTERKQLIQAKLQHCVTALRLIKPGTFYPFGSYVCSYPIKDKFVFNASFSHTSAVEYHQRATYDTDYKLERVDLYSLRKTYRKLTSSEIPTELQALAIGLRKFNHVTGRWLDEDKLIDLVTCLDSTLLNGERHANYYQLAIRGGQLLNRNSKLGLQAIHLLKRLTYTRNRLIHGGIDLRTIYPDNTVIAGNQNYALTEFIELCEDLTREVLKEYLYRISSDVGLAKINNDLDVAVVSTQ